eukprot:SAG11_NODE_661_length_7885_cov_8.956974_14_plen_173_part_00
MPTPVVNVPTPAVNVQAAAGQAAPVGAALVEAVLPKDLLKLVGDAVALVTSDVNTANRACASLESLRALRIDADPSVSLSDGMPKTALQIRPPSVYLPSGIEDEDFCATVSVPLQRLDYLEKLRSVTYDRINEAVHKSALYADERRRVANKLKVGDGTDRIQKIETSSKNRT